MKACGAKVCPLSFDLPAPTIFSTTVSPPVLSADWPAWQPLTRVIAAALTANHLTVLVFISDPPFVPVGTVGAPHRAEQSVVPWDNCGKHGSGRTILIAHLSSWHCLATPIARYWPVHAERV